MAIIAFWEAGRRQKASGLPTGRLVYSDTSRWREQLESLYDPKHGLTGRPDYIIEDGQLIIPVEVKSSRAPRTPYDSHIYQLAAYCLLVQQVYGVRPPYGVLHYADQSQTSRTFAVDYTIDLENSLILLLTEIRTQKERQEIHRSHQSSARCGACGYRSTCEQRLD